MLQTIMRWHSDPEIYEKECGDFPGFVTVVRSGAKNSDGTNKVSNLYENYSGKMEYLTVNNPKYDFRSRQISWTTKTIDMYATNGNIN